MPYCKWEQSYQCIQPVDHEGPHKTWATEKIDTLEAELAEASATARREEKERCAGVEFPTSDTPQYGRETFRDGWEACQAAICALGEGGEGK